LIKSSFHLRNAINEAFKLAGQSELIVRSILPTKANNLVISTTDSFSGKFLLEHKAIWETIIPYKEAKLDQPHYKVAIHGVPIEDFKGPNGLELIAEEITEYNRGIYPIETPH